MDRKMLFLCYTLRGSDLTIPVLEKMKRRIQSTGLFDVYVDILDNRGNTNPQQYVMDRLCEADVFCVIVSDSINNSPWVQMEMNAALAKSLPIIQLTLAQVHCLLRMQPDDAFSAQLCKIVDKTQNDRVSITDANSYAGG